MPLLYRYWWNTRIFPFTKKSYLHRAQWRYYCYLSRVRMLVSPWLLKQFSLFGTKNISIIVLFLFYNFMSEFHNIFVTGIYFAVSKMNLKKVVFYVGISSVSINYTEHYTAAWGYEFYLLVLKVSLTRYFQHSKIKFVSPRGHVISSIYLPFKY